MNYSIRIYYMPDDSVGGDALKGAATGATIGSVIPGVGTLIGAGAGALIGGITGYFQHKKANALLKQNPRPTQSISPEELANQQAAQNMAAEGMPSAQYQAANKNIQRQQAAAISSSQDRRAGTANVGAIQQQTNDATGNLDAQSSMIRRQNQLNLQTVNSQVGAERQGAFDWNQKGKYLQNYQYGMSLLGQGNANMMSGADKLLGGLTTAYGQGLFSGGMRPAGTTGDVNPGYAANSYQNMQPVSQGQGSASPAGLYNYINPSISR